MKKQHLIIFISIIILLILVFLLTSKNITLNQTVGQNNVKELIEYYSNGNGNENEIVFADSNTLSLTNENNTETLSLPEDEFYISIAPYYNMTHPCATHYLTSCRSELVSEDFEITIIDEVGNTILNDTLTSKQNGFIDLWLPRDQQFSIKIVHNGNNIESTLSTFEGDDTCVTTELKFS